MPEETRHYIALTEMGRMVATVGPAPSESFKLDPREPMPLGETLAYPVSAEIAQAWTADDEDDLDDDEDGAA
jgi:hypothetical protein